MVSILLVTPSRAYAEALAAAVRPVAAIVGLSTEVAAAVALVDRLRPDSVLLDSSLAHATEPSLLQKITEKARVLLIGVNDEPNAIASAGHVGAFAVLLREAGLSDLRAALRHLSIETSNGASYSSNGAHAVSSPSVLRVWRIAPDVTTPRTVANLTAREHEVAELVASGLTNKVIALRLSVSVPTVKNHVHNILRKLDLVRRGEIAGQIDTVQASRQAEVLVVTPLVTPRRTSAGPDDAVALSRPRFLGDGGANNPSRNREPRGVGGAPAPPQPVATQTPR